MLHPPMAHFAIVLPLVAAVFGIVYLFTKNELHSKYYTRITLFAAIAMIGAWYTGSQAGPEIYNYLSSEGKEELLEHKSLGLYLAISLGVIAVLQFIGCRMRHQLLQTLSVILLLGATATTFLQGKDGGEIVYEHGKPFQVHMIKTTLDNAVESANEAESSDEKVEIYEDAIDEVKNISEEINALYQDHDEE